MPTDRPNRELLDAVDPGMVWPHQESKEPLRIGVYTAEWFDGVKVSFGDAFHATLTPDQAMEMGKKLLTVGGYLRIFSARFGVPEREAEVSRKEPL